MTTLMITPMVLEAIAVSRFVRGDPNRHTIVDPFAAFRAMPFAARRQWIEDVCDDLHAAHAVVKRPRIVCLCGSTKFWRTFQEAGLKETLAGNIVLSIAAASGTDDEHFGQLPPGEWERLKGALDELHLRKIELADEVLVLNLNGYIGESTRREVAHARDLGKPIRYLESVDQPVPIESER